MAVYFSNHQALVFSLLLLLLTMLLSAAVLFGYRFTYPKLITTDRVWDDIALRAVYLPLQLLIWVYGITYVVEAFNVKTTFFTVDVLEMHLREFTVIFCLLWFFWRCVGYFEYRVTIQSFKVLEAYDKAKLLSLSRFIRVLICVLAAIILLQVSGIPVSGLLAFGGMGALVLGLAAKDLLANFFGGLLIYADRPFTVGDWVSSPDKDIEGIVEAIGWRLTTIRRFDKRVLYIPNSIFSTITLENASQMTHWRLMYSIQVRYADLALVDQLCADFVAILTRNDQVDHQLSYYAKLEELADSSVNIKVLAYTQLLSGEGFMALQHAFLLDIAQAVKAAGADFAFPTQTLDVSSALFKVVSAR